MKKIKNVKDTVQDMKQSFKALAEKQLQGANDVNFTKNKVNDLENRPRRNNICLDGIDKNEKEMWDETERKLQKVIKEDLEIEGSVIIERAHRTGDVRKAIDNKRPRTIVAKLLKDKTLILQKAKEKKLSRKHDE